MGSFRFLKHQCVQNDLDGQVPQIIDGLGHKEVKADLGEWKIPSALTQQSCSFPLVAQGLCSDVQHMQLCG